MKSINLDGTLHEDDRSQLGSEADSRHHNWENLLDVPVDIATCMYYTRIDPFTGKAVQVAKPLRDRRMQRSLLQFFKPENYFEVRKALIETGRTELIGGGCDALIPANPPKEALKHRREQANEALRGDHVHTVENPTKRVNSNKPGVPNRGYRPGRNSQQRRQEKSR